MRSDREFAAEALRRARAIGARRGRVRGRVGAGAALAVCLSAVVFVVAFAGRYPVGLSSGVAASSAPLLFPNAGGYVLVGLICFVVGVAVTVAALRKRKRE